jgi:hypothetical protein
LVIQGWMFRDRTLRSHAQDRRRWMSGIPSAIGKMLLLLLRMYSSSADQGGQNYHVLHVQSHTNVQAAGSKYLPTVIDVNCRSHDWQSLTQPTSSS